jgi:hypothetical protein
MWSRARVSVSGTIRLNEAMSDIIRVTAEIVAVEAPITLDLLTTRIAEGYGVNATKRVRQAIDRAVATLVRRGEFTRDGDTLLRSGPVTVRVPKERDPTSFRDIDQLPPREVAVAVTSLLDDARGLASDELVVSLARLFGFKRTGAKIRQAIEEVVRSLVDEGLVSHRRDGTLQTGEAELPDETPVASEGDLATLIQQGESSHLEFKSTLRTDLSRGSAMKELEKVVAKTIAGFLNGGGGTLLIGVADDGSTVGLEPDYRTLGKKGDRDGFELHLMQVLGRAVGTAALAFVRVNIHKLEEKDVCRVDVRPSRSRSSSPKGRTPSSTSDSATPRNRCRSPTPTSTSGTTGTSTRSSRVKCVGCGRRSWGVFDGSSPRSWVTRLRMLGEDTYGLDARGV